MPGLRPRSRWAAIDPRPGSSYFNPASLPPEARQKLAGSPVAQSEVARRWSDWGLTAANMPAPGWTYRARRYGEAREALSEDERKYGEVVEVHSAAWPRRSRTMLAGGRLSLLEDLGSRNNVIGENARKTFDAGTLPIVGIPQKSRARGGT